MTDKPKDLFPNQIDIGSLTCHLANALFEGNLLQQMRIKPGLHQTQK